METIILWLIGVATIIGLGLIAYACRAWLAVNWRTLLARLPLPMLAFAASYGVYSFSAMFAPEWVAVAQAAAFEATYIGLATLDNLDKDQRNRAWWISFGAVAVSIIYNSLAGIGHRNPHFYDNLDVIFEWGLGILHGAPLAIVAFCVADLLLHRPSATKQISKTQASPAGEIPKSRTLRPIHRKQVGKRKQAQASASTALIATPLDDKTQEVVRLREQEGLTFPQIGKRLGFSRQAAQQRYQAARGSTGDTVSLEDEPMTVDDFLRSIGMTRDKAGNALRSYGLTDPEKAYSTLKSRLPEGMTLEAFTPLHAQVLEG